MTCAQSLYSWTLAQPLTRLITVSCQTRQSWYSFRMVFIFPVKQKVLCLFEQLYISFLSSVKQDLPQLSVVKPILFYFYMLHMIRRCSYSLDTQTPDVKNWMSKYLPKEIQLTASVMPFLKQTLIGEPFLILLKFEFSLTVFNLFSFFYVKNVCAL